MRFMENHYIIKDLSKMSAFNRMSNTCFAFSQQAKYCLVCLNFLSKFVSKKHGRSTIFENHDHWIFLLKNDSQKAK